MDNFITPSTPSGILEAAVVIGESAHAAQTWGEYPYTYHLGLVVMTLLAWGVTDEVVLAAGYLHDILEDTDYTPAELERELICIQDDLGFPLAVPHDDIQATLRLVEALTNTYEGTRRERALPYLSQVYAAGRDAILIKLADRYVNRFNADDRYAQMYDKEYGLFRDLLYDNVNYKHDWATNKAWELLDAIHG